MADEVVLCLMGDVMTGRGIDQILPAPGDPRLWETSVRDARTYVELAESVSGPIDRPVDASWPWGDALPALDAEAGALRLLNLETSVTTSDEPEPGKAVHYRMHPSNIGCLSVARPHACVLANNHVLDFGVAGIEETLDTLAAAGLTTVGAGRDLEEAWRPAVLDTGGHRLLLWAVGTESAGVPPAWAAGERQPGVAHVSALTAGAAAAIGDRVKQVKQPGDIAVLSIHWGSNWGHDVPRRQVRFAHRLIEEGVDIVFGHSSHHPRPVEVYDGGLVLHGCGDFIDDYEGISGHARYRDDLRLVHVARFVPGRGLRSLRMLPFQAHRMRLRRAARPDAEWLAETLTRTSRPFGSRVAVAPDGSLTLVTG